MIKTGICTREDLNKMKPEARHAKGVSYRLLKYGATPSDVAVFERVLRDARLAGGVYRTTYRGRMAAVDEAVGEILRDRFAPEASLEVHDWAASDCLAACEWARRLLVQFPSGRVTASDLCVFLVEVASSTGEALIFEEGGAPLQYVRPPFVLDLNATPSPFYVMNRWLLRRARRRVPAASAAAEAARASWRDLADRRPFESPPWRVERIPLLHPEAIRLSQDQDAFRIVRHNVFEALAAPVAVIRTMNIFNLGYFAPEHLRSGIRAVFESLEPGGLWVVGRTAEEVVPPRDHVTIWEKAGDGFRELLRLGAGSEVADLVRDFRAA